MLLEAQQPWYADRSSPQASCSYATDASTARPRQQATKAEALALLRRYNCTIPQLRGQTILARVVKSTNHALLVDPGFFGLSVIDRKELGTNQAYTEDGQPIFRADGTSRVRPGEYVRLRLSRWFTPYGDMQLEPVRTSPEVRKKLVWEELRACSERGRPVKGRMLNACKGGYAVGVAGYVALLPHGQAVSESISNIGGLQQFYIHKMDDRRKLIELTMSSRSPNYSNVGSIGL